MSEANVTGPGAAADGGAAAEVRRANLLPPAALRALAEAQARRAEAERQPTSQPKELHGRNGPEPTRYGDWEVKGIASDF